MAGRHRHTQFTGARRALAAGVPALGLVGAVAAFTGAEPTTAATAEAAGTVADPASPAAALPAPATPAVTTVAADAATAAGRAGEIQREAERRELHAVVADVRADAQDRRAAAAAQGQEELAAFEQDLKREQEQSAPTSQPEPDTAGSDHDDAPDDAYCDTSVPVTFGDRADADEIIDRDCGLTDLFGRERSTDSWIDGQLLSSIGE